MFAPRSVAVIGATDREGSVARTLLQNLLQGHLPGEIYAVNPRRETVLSLHSYKSIGGLPEKADLAIVVTPAPSVPGVIGECIDAGVRAAVVISAGFKERGAEGLELERKIQEQVRRGQQSGANLRVIGPNCLGIMNPLAATWPSSARAARWRPPSWTGASRSASASAPWFPPAPCSTLAGAT
jgi:acetyltransferase